MAEQAMVDFDADSVQFIDGDKWLRQHWKENVCLTVFCAVGYHTTSSILHFFVKWLNSGVYQLGAKACPTWGGNNTTILYSQSPLACTFDNESLIFQSSTAINFLVQFTFKVFIAEYFSPLSEITRWCVFYNVSSYLGAVFLMRLLAVCLLTVAKSGI